MYHKKHAKPTNFDYELIVIGSGPGGGVGAHVAAGMGKKVALIEAHKFGGDCIHYSCIPTKALLEAATTLRTIQSAAKYGLRATNAGYNPQSLHAWKNKVVAAASGETTGKAFKSDGITTIRGHAHFLNPWTVSVGSHRYTAKKFLIATGSTPILPAIDGLDDTGYITYRDVADASKFPKSIAIIGGGATAYEYGQIFSAFGVRVHIIEQHKHLLAREDNEVGDIIESVLQNYGVRVHTSAKIVKTGGKAGKKLVVFEQHGQEHRISIEEIMVASGKQPMVDIGLENTGVRFTDHGIRVTNGGQTSKNHIFAVGDVTGGDLFAHNAAQQARVAVHNMYTTKKVTHSVHALPRIFYGEPEVAAVGKTEHDLIMSGHAYQTAIAPIGIVGRATTTSFDSGFVKLLATHSGVLVGASVVAPHAGEVLQELTFAIEHGKRACDIVNTVHGFPTWSEAIRIAASRIKCS